MFTGDLGNSLECAALEEIVWIHGRYPLCSNSTRRGDAERCTTRPMPSHRRAAPSWAVTGVDWDVKRQRVVVGVQVGASAVVRGGQTRPMRLFRVDDGDEGVVSASRRSSSRAVPVPRPPLPADPAVQQPADPVARRPARLEVMQEKIGAAEIYTRPPPNGR